MIALTNHAPEFLKAAYKHPMITLTDHERHIKAGIDYITYDGQWRVWRMTPERVPIPRGRYTTLNSAVFFGSK